MAIIEVTVCDVCRNPDRGTVHFTVGEDDTDSELELCRDHAAPLRDLLKHGTTPSIRTSGTTHTQTRPKIPTARKVATRRRRSGFDNAVATMEEIEARKQA